MNGQDDIEQQPLKKAHGSAYDPQLLAHVKLGGDGSDATPAHVPDANLLQNMSRAFGSRFLLIMLFGQLLLRGFTQTLSNTASPYVYAEYHTSSVLVTLFAAIKTLPYACKFLIGITFDMCPVFGYHYAPWMLTASFLGVSSYLCMFLLPKDVFSAGGLTAMLFFARLQEATVDIGINCHMAKHYKKNPSLGPSLSVFFMGGTVVFSYLAGSLYGLLVNDGVRDPRLAFGVCAGISVMVIPLICSNFHGEKKVTRDEASEVHRQLWEDKELFVLGFLICVLAVSLSIAQLIVHAALWRLIISIAIVAIAILALNVILGPEIAKPQSYELIAGSCVPNLSAASFYFYTDSPQQFTAGPHFSPMFYTSVLSIVGLCGTLLGIAFFLRFMYRLKFRQLFMIPPIVLAILRIPDLILFSRLNVRLGISDRVFVLGAEPLTYFVQVWPMMMGSILVYKCSPAGLEATIVSILTSYANFSAVVTDAVGAFVLEVAGVNPKGMPQEDDQFGRLWQATLIAMLIPLLPLALLNWLLPNARLTDEFLVTNAESPTAGSWLNRWRGRPGPKASPFW